MPFRLRPRWPRARSAGQVALTVALLALVASCGEYPNSVFHNRTEFNRETDWLFQLIIWVGGFVFVFVEVLLLWVVFRYRSRPGQREPEHVHGNTKLEIMWTAIPAVVLIGIAIPTVDTIFETQAEAKADALQVEVIGHQWWWEFRYPQYTTVGADGRVDTLVTANELYLPQDRTVNFTLKSVDVIHSFWIPALGGKRDLITNRTNYLWFTPDSAGTGAWNGACVEYCGASHANMRFKAFTVSPEDFESWARHELSPGAIHLAAASAGAPAGGPAPLPQAVGDLPPGQQTLGDQPGIVPNNNPSASETQAGPRINASGPAGAGVPAAAPETALPGVSQSGFIAYPRDRIPAHVIPTTPMPDGLTVDTTLAGDATRGQQLMVVGGCIGCHAIRGNPMAKSPIGPNLTHVANRSTIGAGLYPNTKRHLMAWIKNAPLMKPGSIMPTIGKGEVDPQKRPTVGNLTDQQIADIVAYLQALK